MPIILDGTAGIDNNATDLSYTGTLTGGTGVVNLGSGQLFKDASGNVGIGTSSPAQRLHLAQAGQPRIEFEDTTNSSKGRITTGGSTGSMTFDADPDNTKAGTVMTFNVDATERARIDSSGNLLVGTTSNPSSMRMRVVGGAAAFEVSDATVSTGTTGYFGFQVRGDIGAVNLSRSTGNAVAFFNSANASGLNGTPVGIISITTTATTYATSSDYRLKHDIQPMTGALAKVAALKPVTYKWNADDSADEGFIAHELQEVCPSAVTGEKDAVDAEGNPQYQGIDTSFLVATLTAAIQEQQAIIESLTARVVALEQA